MQTPGEQRQRLSAGIYAPTTTDEPFGRLEEAFRLAYQGDKIARTISKAVRAGKIKKGPPEEMAILALEQGLITQEELELLIKAENARNEAIQVDAFTLEEYNAGAVVEVTE